MYAFLEKRLEGEDFKVWQMSYLGLCYISHWHREIELIRIKRGEAEITVNGKAYSLADGDIFICKSGAVHALRSNPETELTIYLLSPDVLGSIYASVSSICGIVRKRELQAEFQLELDKNLDGVSSELKDKKDYYKNATKSYFVNFFVQVARNFKDELNSEDAPSYEKLSNLQRLLDYIDENKNKNVTLSQAAEIMHFSPCHFSKIFKDRMGINYVQYCNSVKIEKAAELLATENVSVCATAKELGFSNIRTFNRVFRDVTGYTPTEYRRRGSFKSATEKPKPRGKLAIISYVKEFW